MTPLAMGFLTQDQIQHLEYVGAGLVVLVVFVVASRFIAQLISGQLHRRNVRTDMVVLSRRVVYVVVIGFGLLGAFDLAFQTANVTLVGILIATVVAALGVQQLLQDYVSGYYVLLERHIRVGDRIGVDDKVGIVGEVKLRVTLLRSDRGDLIVVPNSELFSKAVTVYTKESPEAHAAKPEVPKPEPPG
jgi:small conductance mechanosensitive channel